MESAARTAGAPRVMTMKEAALLLEPGERTLALGGNSLHRVPHAFVRALARREDLALHLVKTAGAYDIDMLCLAGLVRSVSAGFIGYETEFGLARHYRRAVESGAVEAREHACYTVITALRAAAYGMPFLPVNALEGSDLVAARGFERVGNPYPDSATKGSLVQPAYVAIPAIVPDLAVIHVQWADRLGNGVIIGPKNEDLLIARSARRLILTAERIVDSPDELPVPVDHIDIPSVLVHGLVEAPQGAAPGSCAGEYEIDSASVRKLLALTSREELLDHLDAWDRGGATIRESRAGAGNDAGAGARTVAASRFAQGGECASADWMAVAMARLLADSTSAFHGLASPLPAVAIALARRLHNPTLRYLNIAGGVDIGSEGLAVSTCGPSFLDGSESFFSLTDIFDLSARGELDTAFLGGVQVDRSGAINNSVIGPFDHPKVKLPGGAGSAAIVPTARHTIVWRTRHDARSLVERCEFVTTRGNVREVVTPLGVFVMEDGELRIGELFPGVDEAEVQAATGFPIVAARGYRPFPEVTEEERRVLAEVDPHGVRYSEFGS